MIKQRRPIVLTKKARTTPNPFIPETNNADYDIMKPDIYRPEVDIDNTDSYQLVSTFSYVLMEGVHKKIISFKKL